MRFNEKVAIVTGAGGGIGRGIAECLAEVGAFVVLNDVRAEGVEASLRLLGEKGYPSEAVVADISTPEGAGAVIDAAARLHGRLDLLVHCAGRQIIKPVEVLQPQEWDTVLGVNLKGAYLCARAALPLLAQQRGSIINICSVHAQASVEGFSSYAASKAGIVALTRSLAIECGPRGVRVNAISPGTIDSPLLQDYFNSLPDPARARTEFLKFHPIGRFGTARDIGNMVTFLASDETGFITGAEIVVDGGMTALLFKE